MKILEFDSVFVLPGRKYQNYVFLFIKVISLVQISAITNK
jgi:hypothetical protein